MTRELRRGWRVALTLGTVAALVGAVAVGLAAPASADPVTTYVSVGSDTTQDVMDQVAKERGNGVVGSWDAINPVTAAAHEVIVPKGGCSMTRPNGSGEGLSALRKSINPNTTAAQLADPPEPGCIDFSRSSSGPGTHASVTGALQYVPFALDAVATATGPATAVGGPDPAVATAITQADGFTLAQVQDMYKNCNPQVVNGVTYDPTGATGTPIHLYIPQPGSGTRNFWAGQMGIPDPNNPPSCVHDHSVLDPTEQVEEHDGTIFAQDANAFGPFSIAQWVAQKNGHHDRRHNAVLHSLGGVAPLTAGGSLNTAYPVKREVYNVALRSLITNGAGGPGTDVGLSNLLSGSTSRVCGDLATIVQFGFAPLNSAPLGHTCGQISNDLRAFDPATDPV
jgi:ABC-type phosphate transport system substrate-binding protein